MPELLQLGVATSIVPGVVYALPRMTVTVSSQGGTIEISNDGSNFTALGVANVTSAPFIRTTGSNSIVTVTK